MAMIFSELRVTSRCTARGGGGASASASSGMVNSPSSTARQRRVVQSLSVESARKISISSPSPAVQRSSLVESADRVGGAGARSAALQSYDKKSTVRRSPPSKRSGGPGGGAES